MKKMMDPGVTSLRLPLFLMLMFCILYSGVVCAGCGNKSSSSTAGGTGASPIPGSGDLKDLDQKTPEMVCSEYFEAFRKRDMDTLKRCTTEKSFGAVQNGIKYNPSYEGVRNYSYTETTCEKDEAKVMARGEIQPRGKWVQTTGMILLKKDHGRWKVIEGKWEVPSEKKETAPPAH